MSRFAHIRQNVVLVAEETSSKLLMEVGGYGSASMSIHINVGSKMTRNRGEDGGW